MKGKTTFKRLMAMLLCAMQLMSCVPHAHAEDVATDGEAQHDHSVQTLDGDAAAQSAGTEDQPVCETHDWTNYDGVCAVCGYVCAHPSDQVTVINGSGAKDHVYTSNNDGTHSYYKVPRTLTTCKACSWSSVESGEAETTLTTDACAYDVNGVCVHCDYVVPCETHTKSYEVSVTDGEKSYEKTAEGHAATYERTTTYHCDVCARDFDEKQNVTDAMEAHNWADGMCSVCGYACAHENKTYQATSTALGEGEAWTADEDGQTHYAMGYYIDEYTCNDCGGWVSEESTTLEKLVKEHWYEAGSIVCGSCGYENTCEHTKKETQTSRVMVEYYTPVDGLVHKSVYNKYEDVYCYDCDTVLSSTLVEENVTTTELHWYNDGKCICGYETLCDHAEYAEKERYSLTSDAVAVDSETHKGTYNKYVDRTCQLCGNFIGSELLSEGLEMTLGHNFRNGECSDCGYDNGCEHDTGTYPYTWYGNVGAVKYVDAHYHSYTATQNIYYYCNTCNEQVSAEKTDNFTVTEAHTLNGENVCIYCEETGEVIPEETETPAPEESETPAPEETETPCGHENTITNVFYQYTADLAEDDGMTHTGTADRYEQVWCYDCKSEVRRTLLEANVTWTEEHLYSDGVCACGRKSLCDHPEYREKTTHAATSAVVAVDGETHKGTYNEYTYRWCLVCNAYVGRELIKEGVEMTFAHGFDMGKCIECGYANACAHDGETRTTTWYEDGQDIQYIDKHYHRYTATECVNTFCSLCGEWLKTDETPNVTVTEAHTLNGENVCIYCEETGEEPECTHEKYTDGKCDECGTVCAHEKYTDGACDECGTVCAHEKYTESACDECGVICAHEKYTDGTCDECGAVCAHEKYTDGACDECGAVCAHDKYTDGTCDECGTVCAHEKYTDGKCDECGTVCAHEKYTDGTCDECGTVCAHEKYTDGVCDECGTVCAHEKYTDGVCDE